MSKTVHPYSHRLVILRDWKSRWFATGRQYATLLRGDVLLREYLAKKLRGFYISSLDIERSPKTTRIIIRTSRPGMLIGRQGEGAQKLREDITKFFKKKAIKVPEDLKLDIVEVTSPDSDAHIIAYSVAEGLEKRLPFRRVLKTTIEKVMAVRGVEDRKSVV